MSPKPGNALRITDQPINLLKPTFVTTASRCVSPLALSTSTGWLPPLATRTDLMRPSRKIDQDRFPRPIDVLGLPSISRSNLCCMSQCQPSRGRVTINFTMAQRPLRFEPIGVYASSQRHLFHFPAEPHRLSAPTMNEALHTKEFIPGDRRRSFTAIENARTPANQ